VPLLDLAAVAGIVAPRFDEAVVKMSGT
jgi:hypothetical protein